MRQVVWGIRCGQQGYFLPPNVSFTITAGLIVTFTFYKVVAAASERVEDEFIPDTYISAGYLSKCFERRGGEAKGFIKSFQQQYARFGRKKVQFNHSRNILPSSASTQLNSTSTQAEFSFILRQIQPPTHPATHPPVQNSSEMRLKC